MHEARKHRFLTGVARERGAARVAVAHTADDQAETVLLRALRGTGIAGLGGMPRRRELEPGVWLVRPALAVTRAEVEAYLRDAGLAALAVVDSSNADRRFLRNRIGAFVALPLQSIDRMVLGTRLKEIGAVDGSTVSRGKAG